MKFLAIERELKDVNWKYEQNILKEEAYRVNKLMNDDILREIYFTENKNAVLILECTNKEQAVKTLSSLPLVKNGIIAFDVFSLMPYTGLSRIIK